MKTTRRHRHELSTGTLTLHGRFKLFVDALEEAKKWRADGWEAQPVFNEMLNDYVVVVGRCVGGAPAADKEAK